MVGSMSTRFAAAGALAALTLVLLTALAPAAGADAVDDALLAAGDLAAGAGAHGIRLAGTLAADATQDGQNVAAFAARDASGATQNAAQAAQDAADLADAGVAVAANAAQDGIGEARDLVDGDAAHLQLALDASHGMLQRSIDRTAAADTQVLLPVPQVVQDTYDAVPDLNLPIQGLLIVDVSATVDGLTTDLLVNHEITPPDAAQLAADVVAYGGLVIDAAPAIVAPGATYTQHATGVALEYAVLTAADAVDTGVIIVNG